MSAIASLAGPHSVLDGGAVAVKATPLRGRLQAEPWQPPQHRADRPLSARGVVWCCTVAAGYG